jgi:hypothetical protein
MKLYTPDYSANFEKSQVEFCFFNTYLRAFTLYYSLHQTRTVLGKYRKRVVAAIARSETI